MPWDRSTRRALVFTILALAAAFAADRPALAQSGFPVAIGHVEGRTYYIRESALYVVDHDARSWTSIPVPSADTLFHPNGRPDWYSTGIDPERRALWIWDRSVGPTLRINLDDLTDQRPVGRRSSHAQFNHAGGLDPRTGYPLAFSGYGFYRAKDFIITYDRELGTWVELPTYGPGPARGPNVENTRVPAAPAPRMNAVMATSFSDSLIAVVGGGIDGGDDPIPHYSLSARDAWLFNLNSGRWAPIPFEPWLECHVRYAAEQIGQLPGSRASESVYFWMSELCPIDPKHGHLRNSVIEWRPLEARWRPIAGFERVPEPQKLTMIEVPSGRPAGRVTADRRASSDSVRVGFLNRKATDEMFGADIVVMTAPLPTHAEWITLDPLPSERRAALWPWVLAGLLFVGGGVAWILNLRRGALSATVYPGQDRLEIVQGRTRTSAAIQPHVCLLLEGLASARNGDDLIDPDDLLEHFEERYPDLESARAMRNKAYNEANDLAEQIAGQTLIERIQREDDRRRYLYRLLMPVRVR